MHTASLVSPRRGLEEVALSVHEFRPEPRHLVFHLAHLAVEPLSDVGELCVDDAEVSELDGDVPLLAVRHAD